MKFSQKSGFTLIEVLIVLVIIGILIAVFFTYINPLGNRDKAADSQRKADLDKISIALEEYYSDNDCYPTQDDYQNDSTVLVPYLNNVPCDPDTNEAYYYSPEDTTCPQYYRIYTDLVWTADEAIAEVGCSLGCGPGYSYNYGVSSPNVSLTNELPLDVGCTGVNNCAICQADENGLCACNAAEYCRPDDQPCPPDVTDCYPASICFPLGGSCGGYAGEPMPY